MIFAVSAQIPCWGKFFFLRYGPKCSQLIRLRDFLISHQRNSLIYTNSRKLKVDQNFLGGPGQKWVWPVWSQDSKIDCTSRMNR